MTTININASILGYNDLKQSNNPLKRPINWTTQILGIDGKNAGNQPYTIPAQSVLSIFNGTRSILADGTTEYSLSLNALDPSRYRLKWTGTGTNPAFRTSRSVSTATGTLSFVLNPNQTVTVTSSLGAVFGAVQANDTVFVPGVSTGDTAGPFDPLNEGFWVVLSASTTSLTLARPVGVFEGKTETVSIASNTKFQAWSATGVQVGDTLDLTSSNFATVSQRLFEVIDVRAGSVDFISTLPLPDETKVPGAMGIQFFSQSKYLLMVETNQDVSLRINGDISDNVIVEPVTPNDDSFPGIFIKTGTIYSLSIKNLSASDASVVVMTAERA